MIRFRLRYALAALALFAVEVAIALYVHDDFIRPWFGDTLVVVLVYAGLRTVTPLSVRTGAAVAFGIAALVEFGQAIDLVDRIGLGHYPLARIVLGTSFDWGDFLAYALGALGALAVEWWWRRGER